MWVLWFLLNVIPITCKGELKYISSFFDYKVSYHNSPQQRFTEEGSR